MALFYLSSTYSDLKEHRDAAAAAFREFARMSEKDYVNYELFIPEVLAAEDSSPLEACLHKVRESDYFILLLGWRYGYIPEGSEKSIVELEYEAAIERGIPRFCFIIDDQYPVSPRYIETGIGADKLRRFKAKVQEIHYVSRFSTPADLARELTLSVSVLNRPLDEATQALAEWGPLTREYRQSREELNLLREIVDFYKEKLNRVVPADPIWRCRNFEQDNTLCFVLMPFSDSFFLQYEEVILPALEASGLKRNTCRRDIWNTRDHGGYLGINLHF